MLNIGFILPTTDYLFDPFRGDPHTHFYLLTLLEEHFKDRVNLSLIDLRGIKKEAVLQHIPECDVYLYTGFTLDYNEQLFLISQLRDLYPDAKHITGGPHPNTFPEECLKNYDSVVLGEGEKALVRLIEDVMAGRLEKIYKQDSPIDINAYPFPRRKFIPKAAVAKQGLMTLKKEGYDKIWGTTAIFSRGCPFYCYFCAMPYMKKYGSSIRYRKPELVEEEISYLKREYNIEGLNLIDEIAIPLEKNTAVEHLRAFARSNVVWRGQCRVNGLTPEIARLAKESGCIALGLGVESAHQQCLDILNKKINVEESKKTIRVLKEAGIETRVFLIMGLPGEPQDIVKKTWDFIEETQPDLVILSFFCVRPGTIIFSNPKNFGIRAINTDWERTMHLFGRYDDEVPQLTFEYEENTPWGKGLSGDRIINNYLELQQRLKQHKLCSLPPVSKIQEQKTAKEAS